MYTKVQYREASKNAEKIINQARNDYYRGKLQRCEGDAKGTFAIVNKLLDKEYVSNKLPNGLTDEKVANELKDHFHDKIKTIYDNTGWLNL